MELKIFSVTKYQPKIRQKSISGRVSHSFLYIEEGEYVYHFKNEKIKGLSGDVIFLPKGSSYEYKIISETAKCYQVEFNLKANGQFADWESPTLLSEKNSEMASKYFPDLFTSFRKGSEGLFKSYSIVMHCLSLVNDNSEKPKSKIKPALDYIEQNYTLEFSATFLSSLCNMSASQLRRLFQTEIGMSPLKYRNSLRIKEASALLKSRELSVSEISDILNFDTPYAFSKAFKNEKGISPKAYQMKNKK
ncbi:MAG: helix-turn-helix domain-containing protein [Clostridia bacterium]|nr:helix-turn-helix domain-containing protein [Clostridia bacterium]